MARTVNVNFRLDEDVKNNMEQACTDMGLSMSAAVIAELPFCFILVIV